MATPKLRFKEFNGDWNTVNLKNCIESIDSGWSPQCESYPANSSQWGVLKTTSVDWSGFQENANKKLPDHLEPRPEIEVKPYDILVTRAGPTERVGVVSVVPNNVRKKLLISDKLIRIKSNKDNDPNFLGISLSSSKCQNQLQSKTSGLAKSQTNISQKILLDVTLQTPSKPEQTKIATFLSAVDEKISQLSQKLHLLGQYKQGMMQKLFSQQIRFKADDSSEFGEWQESLLGQNCQITTGKLDANAMKVDGEYRFYTCAKDYYFIDNFAFDTEALLISGNGAHVGYIHYYKGKFNAYQRTYVLDGWKHNIQYVKYFLEKYLKMRIYGEKKEGNTPYIVLSTLSEMPFQIPCLEEQTKIANFLSSIDQKIDVVSEQLEQAKLWKKGLLQQMFV